MGSDSKVSMETCDPPILSCEKHTKEGSSNFKTSGADVNIPSH